jgi:mono/diheme cytochrome c family protein
MKTVCLFVLFAMPLWAKLTPEQLEKLPAPVSREVNFSEVKPILEASCIKCHGRGKDKGGFRIDNRETFLKGGDSGPVALEGNSKESLLIHMVSGLDPDNVMPQKGSKLKPEQVGLLRAWIDQGVKWDAQVTFGKLPPVNLVPHKPDVPEVEGVEHPVDRFVHAYLKAKEIAAPKPVEDRIFARRAYLDAIGLLPTPGELEKFAGDSSADKRKHLVKELLGRNLDYAQNWMTFWNDVLRNDYKGTGYIDGGRKQITGWLFNSLATNKSYNQFVAELIDPTAESEGFSKGIVWRGVVNASQTPQMQAAQNISQVFMGVNLKCASCHDSFINDWTLADSYGLASIYADGPLEMFKCDQPTGKQALMRFIYPELGEIDAKMDKKERLYHLADLVTSNKNGRLTRTIVNRLWARLMGRGIVEPVDDMDAKAWSQDLLDFLAADLVENNYDLKHTLELIMTSEAYQMPTVAVSEETSKDFVFRGPMVRRLSAEQFLDAMGTVAGVWNEKPAAEVNFSLGTGGTLDPNLNDLPGKPKWIWKDSKAAEKTEAVTIYLRKFVELPEEPTRATLVATCDNSFKLYINGEEAGSGKDHTKPSVIDVKKYLRKGINLIAVAASNSPGAPDKADADQSNPAGLLLYARVRQVENEKPERVMDFGTDSSWLWSIVKEDGWEKPAYAAAGWYKAAELGDGNIAPWALGQKVAQIAANLDYYGRIRAVLVPADPLMTALGRPNREQVITTRSSVATTLQALELTNGPTLANTIKKGADKLLARTSDPDQLVKNIYERALGREPKSEELNLSKEVVGSPAQKDGVEDLLWATLMLPEFQLIY